MTHVISNKCPVPTMNQKKLLTTTIIILIALSPTAYSPKPLIAHAQIPTSTPIISITGMVTNPLDLTLSDLQAMPQTTEYAVLYCVASPGNAIQHGDWTGVSLSYLLQLANVSASAIKVAFSASDGYCADLPVSMVMQDNSILLAYQKDNASLSELQLVVPGNWGYKWISGPTQMQLVNYNFLGTTESEGYPDDATIGNTGTSTVRQSTSFYSNSTATSNLYPTATPSSPAPSPAPTATPTTHAVASNPKSQAASTWLVMVASISVIVAVCAAALAVAWIKHNKTKPAAA